ncbi:unnamed protein product [Linum trigynum]|uniref:Uncharacterized protein n=1 Tax=Linum trigynum TaxID=586398 RepID=A0AAV2G5V2_9ROSI
MQQCGTAYSQLCCAICSVASQSYFTFSGNHQAGYASALLLFRLSICDMVFSNGLEFGWIVLFLQQIVSEME